MSQQWMRENQRRYKIICKIVPGTVDWGKGPARDPNAKRRSKRVVYED